MKRMFVAQVALLAVFLASATFAQSAQPLRYPERPVRLVVGFPPGGATDTIARIVAPRYNDLLGRPWVIDNRGGAGGNLATELVAKASADGHTVLLAASNALTSNPLLYKLPVDVAVAALGG